MKHTEEFRDGKRVISITWRCKRCGKTITVERHLVSEAEMSMRCAISQHGYQHRLGERQDAQP